MFDWLRGPWPWYVAGPILGSMAPLLFLIGNRSFGISSTLRHICAATIPADIPFLKYDWKSELWNLFFAAGILIGAFLAAHVLPQNSVTSVSAETFDTLRSLGVQDTYGFVPDDIFSWSNLLSFQGFCFVVIGGALVGFGTRYAGGCTSGHGLTGTALLQKASFIALIAFFIGGLISTHLVLPFLLKL